VMLLYGAGIPPGTTKNGSTSPKGNEAVGR
jgi:hypothetical protein